MNLKVFVDRFKLAMHITTNWARAKCGQSFYVVMCYNLSVFRYCIIIGLDWKYYSILL